jgi:hypothetical protein
MKRIVIASALMMLLAALTAQAQTVWRPEYELGAWVGTWTGEVKYADNQKETFEVTLSCTWSPSQYDVVCDQEDSLSAHKHKELKVFGYSVENRQYFFFFMDYVDNLEFSGMSFGKINGSIWTFYRSLIVTGKMYKNRTKFNFISPNECTETIEHSEDGKSWKIDTEIKWAKEVTSL